MNYPVTLPGLAAVVLICWGIYVAVKVFRMPAQRPGVSDSLSQKMNVSWTDALSLWWSFTWRMIIFATLCSVISGFVVMLIGGAQPALSYFIGLLGSFPLSLLTMKLAVGRYVGQPQSWRSSIAHWWSLTWRLTLYAASLGLIIPLLVATFVGRPSEHLGFLFPECILIFGPIEIVAFRQTAVAHSLSPIAKESCA